jgi:Ca-activated chloride channel family protein
MAVPRFVLAVVLLFLAAPVAAQPGQNAASNINGLVTSADGLPLADVVIRLSGTEFSALSNAEGRYLMLLPASTVGRTFEITASFVGYGLGTDSVTVARGSNVLDFTLESQVLQLDPIVVTGTAIAAQRREVGNSIDMIARARPLAEQARGDVNIRGLTSLFGPYPGDREGYAAIEENIFKPVSSAPLSTFSIDVDRASYANVRRFLTDGEIPPRDAVRIEELVNYFPYDDPEPTDDLPFAITTEYATTPWNADHRLLRVALKAKSIDMSRAPASNLVFLMDVSGSMNRPDKLPLLKKAFEMLVETMRPQDRVAIVVYAGAAGLVLESTPGTEKGTILEAIERLRAGGSTAGGAGIQLAYEVAARNHIAGGNNRVILATDGDFNVGASSDAEMVELIEEKRAQGTFLTVLGFGTGNLQDAKMEQIADHGNGNFHYIDSALEARKSLVAEAGGTLFTIAKDVKIQIEFNPTTVAGYRLIGYENRLLADEDFNDDTKDAGELGAGHSVIALYEVVPAGMTVPGDPSVDPLRYSNRGEPSGIDAEAAYVKLRYKEPDGDESRLITHTVLSRPVEATQETRWASAVAAFGMILRESDFVADYRLADVRELAQGARGEDPQGYRGEFLQLVDMADQLMATQDDRDAEIEAREGQSEAERFETFLDRLAKGELEQSNGTVRTLQADERPLVFLDGQRILNLVALAELPGSSIDRIEVIRGPAARTLYGGDAVHGVVQIFTRE